MERNQPVVVRSDPAGEAVKIRFYNFLTSFQAQAGPEANESEGPQLLYIEQIVNMIRLDKTTVFVDFAHLNQYDAELAEAVQLEYYRFEPFLRKAVQEYVVAEHKEYVSDADKGVREFFVSIYNLPRVERIRNLRTECIGRLVAFSGTVTRSSEVRPELLLGSFVCRKCGTVAQGIEQQCSYTEPQICRNNCPSRDFQVLMDQCVFVDWQRLRVQENADEIPAGSMPRCIDVICRNDTVESAKAGDKVVFSGSVVVVPDDPSVSRGGDGVIGVKGGRGGDNFADGVSGLKALGVREMAYKMLFIASSIQHTDRRFGDAMLMSGGMDDADVADSAIDFTKEELQDISNMRSSPRLYQRIAESLCPSVFGHSEVKKGILLMLLGGVHKTTPEGISLRGDLNVCIVGDPSCAKSQFLKYVHEFLPRSVYTSGKASSAAGLTASVVKDSETGDYCVEAGALMLADNGICCIDEFDKMDPNDQVAIHEAMEQQTISITKAGIQATLNARTSILAAANPIFGRYDRSKTLKANVAISAAIMSRFDLFFVILDECNPKVDEAIARHIVLAHTDPAGRNRSRDSRAEQLGAISGQTLFSTEQLRRYIKFARRLNPIVDKEGKKVLVECYRLLRQNDILGKNKTAFRITVRQLESLVRLSEALARLHLDDKSDRLLLSAISTWRSSLLRRCEAARARLTLPRSESFTAVQPRYIREAYRLLQQSIIFVEAEDIELMEEAVADEASGDGEGAEEAGSQPHNDFGDDAADTVGQVLDSMGQCVDENNANVNQPAEDVHSGSVGQKRAMEGAAIDPADQSAEKKQRKADKAKTQISSSEYRNITQLIALHLREQEDLEGPDFVGCKWSDVVAWYLGQRQSELTNEEEFEKKRKIVGQVLRRMLKHEESIIEVSTPTADAENASSSDDRVIRLHPSYEIEG